VEGEAVEVTVSTPSRLHFGMIDMRGDMGRIHGSVGVTIDRPRILLKASPSSQLQVKGFRSERVRAYAETILQTYDIDGAANIELISDINEHSGFGSGTQLALAVGAAISRLYSLWLTPEEIAVTLGRSKRSGVGVYAFKQGGFIIDGGHRLDRKEELPPLIFNTPVPEDWRFVIGLPEIARNHHGELEHTAFKNIEPPPPQLIGEISRVILVQMMPAILERDVKAFGEAMTAIDFKFGEFWLKVQGGRFSSPVIEDGVNFLLEAEALGVGQSSWGPAFYGLAEGEDQANSLLGQLGKHLNSGGRRGEVFIARPDNKGAVIELTR
jgi:beta-ribofuranosylaminobenzene 5'-phosphate synthase